MSNDSNQKPTLGILAYGSLIPTPGTEIEEHCINVINDVTTPFPIEFARKSGGRGDAPTLVPVTNGGAQVNGQVFVMDLSEVEVADVLYRREINRVGDRTRTYKNPSKVTQNTVLVERLVNFAGLDLVLYTKIAATIAPLTPEHLADLAIASVEKADPGRDGITYLVDAKKNGIVTALSESYEEEILHKTGCQTLELALTELKG